MREIKFRAWDKEAKRMVYYETDCSAPDMTLNGVLLNHRTQSNVSDKYILMQYTGLKDKNGKEIYEGDIIQHSVPKKTGRGTYDLNKSETVTRVVEWGDFVRCGFNIMGCTQKIYEVIGNIHENPELLEKQG